MEDNIKSFIRVLDPADNSTGGGTASAIAGAMAAALSAMVARLSIGKSGLESTHYYQAIIDEAEILSRRLFEGARQDSESFDAVMVALQMPKNSEDERAARQMTIAKVMLHATEVPLSNAESCRRVIELCKGLKGRSNPNAGSDLECAFFLAKAGLNGCLANVAINLPKIKNTNQAHQIKSQAEKIGLMD